MAIGTPVQIGAAADATSSPWAITTTGAASADSTLFILLTLFQNTSVGTFSVTTTGGLTWTAHPTLSEGTYGAAVMSAPAPGGLATSTALGVSVTGGGSTLGAGLTVIYATGLGTPVLTDSAFDYNDPGSTADWWGGAGTQNVDTTAEALILAATFGDGSLTTSVTDSPGTELSDYQDATNSWNHTTAYRIETTGGSYTLDGNFAAAQGFGTATGLWAFQAQEAPPGPRPTFNPIPLM